jgi:acyl-CoA dehydrogenase
LASHTTQARRDGDGYIIDGTKIWTTRAHVSDMMVALLRTSSEGKPREGLSMFAIPMASNGVTVRPILSITGDHELNQVFFDDVRIPEAARLGEEGQGWEIARYLLEFERGGGLYAARHRASLSRVRRAIDAARPGLLDQDWAARRFAEVVAAVDSFEQLEFSTLGNLEPGESAGNLSSVLKLRSSRLKQEIGEMAIELLGSAGADRERCAGLVATVVADHLEARATTIFGGASEVQLDIIARSLLVGGAI